MAAAMLVACEKDVVDEGTITGATWLNNDNLDNSDNIPAVGSTYQGCYVLAVVTLEK